MVLILWSQWNWVVSYNLRSLMECAFTRGSIRGPPFISSSLSFVLNHKYLHGLERAAEFRPLTCSSYCIEKCISTNPDQQSRGCLFEMWPRGQPHQINTGRRAHCMECVEWRRTWRNKATIPGSALPISSQLLCFLVDCQDLTLGIIVSIAGTAGQGRRRRIRRKCE